MVQSVTTKWGNIDSIRRFQPNTFHACFLVCKLWYRTLLPILWREYDFEEMQRVPTRIITRYSLLFRHFRSHGGCDGPFNCTLLESLDMRYDVASKATNMSMQTQRTLVRMNPGVEVLQWEGSEASKTRARLDETDFEQLDNIRDLQLDRWNSYQGSLVKALGTMARTLERLELSGVHGFKESDLPKGQPQGRKGDTGVSGGADKGSGGCELVLPIVKTLRVPYFPKNTDLIYLAGCCPDLQQFTVDITIARFDMSRLASTLKNHCPRLSILVINDNHDEFERGFSIGSLIRGCSLYGLSTIKFAAMTPRNSERDLLCSILAHSATLEHITVDYFCELQGAFDPKEILRVLVECRRLKTLSLSGSAGMSTLATLKFLQGQPWGCHGLEQLAFDFDGEIGGMGMMGGPAWRTLSNTVDISSTTSFMGWYRHPQDSSILHDEEDAPSKLCLKELFGMVKGQDRLQFVALNLVSYSRSPDPRLSASW
ncbi:hypothetical protein KI688_000937 [Linnemannia hyalina]|uniref:F-box domain-containing protein n=1 Tax=Linnemannia hyalina TaxID=64524 RepID=A0A9P8BYH6_9FUNG|nr:hypothetical protein KI688_000937 [Linnemannia hyalina]